MAPPPDASFCLLRAVQRRVDAAQVRDDLEGLVHQQGGLVDDCDPLEIAHDVKAGRETPGKEIVEARVHLRIPAGDDLAE